MKPAFNGWIRPPETSSHLTLPSSGESANLRSRFRDDAVGATASRFAVYTCAAVTANTPWPQSTRNTVPFVSLAPYIQGDTAAKRKVIKLI